MEREYPQKVLDIYEAVGRLMSAGRDIGGLKVSDITKEAGIGKGTAYEYFSSKEEIIGQAVCYQMQGMMQQAIGILDSAQSIQEQLEKIIEWTESSTATSLLYNFLKLQVKVTDNATDMQKKISEAAAVRDRFLEQVADIMLKAAVGDGMIPEQKEWSYSRMVMVAAIMMLMEMCISRCKGGSCRYMSSQMMLDYTMRILTKALN